MSDLHHLRPLRAVKEPTGPSLEFTLMAAVKHSERGEGPAMLTALTDALWMLYSGDHERVDQRRFIELIEAFGGTEWTPPDKGGKAA